MSKIDESTVLHLARLARLKLTGEEVSAFAKEFSEIVTYIEQLSEANTEGLKPTYQVNGLSTVTRPDEIVNYGTTPKDLLKNVPDKDGQYIKVKKMLS